MPSKRPADRFNDIIRNIDAVSRHAAGMTQEQFLADEKAYDATQLCLLRISEAATKLGSVAEEIAPEQPRPHIRGLGNFLRHEYDKVDGTEIWRIVVDDLKPRRASCTRAIEQIRQSLGEP